MARPGDRIHVPDFVEWLEFEEITSEALRYEISFRPHAILTREHIHPHQTERHEVLAGRMRLEVDGAVHPLGPDDSMTVAAGVRHAIRPDGDGDVRMRFELRPPLRWEELIEVAGRLAERRQRNVRGYPNPLLLALLAVEYRPELTGTRPPVPVQDLALRPLAAIATRLGYRRRYLTPATPSRPAANV